MLAGADRAVRKRMHRFNRRMQDFDPWDPAKLNISGASLLAIVNLTEVRTSTRQYHPCPADHY